MSRPAALSMALHPSLMIDTDARERDCRGQDYSGVRHPFKDLLGALNHRRVDHLSIDSCGCPCTCLNGVHHALRPFDLGRCMRERLVHRANLPGMDTKLRTKAEISRFG